MKAKPHTWTVEHGRPMFTITVAGVPATIERLHRNEMKNVDTLERSERMTFIAATTMNGCINRYLYFFGFKWAERPDNVAVAKLK